MHWKIFILKYKVVQNATTLLANIRRGVTPSDDNVDLMT